MSNAPQMQQVSEEFQHMVEEFFLVQSRYSAAIREIQTKLEILDDEFQMRHQRNPIHHMQSRLKSIQSMLDKLKRRNQEVSIKSAVDNLQDIAGILAGEGISIDSLVTYKEEGNAYQIVIRGDIPNVLATKAKLEAHGYKLISAVSIR